jgi:hypothetical protein
MRCFLVSVCVCRIGLTLPPCLSAFNQAEGCRKVTASRMNPRWLKDSKAGG